MQKAFFKNYHYYYYIILFVSIVIRKTKVGSEWLVLLLRIPDHHIQWP